MVEVNGHMSKAMFNPPLMVREVGLLLLLSLIWGGSFTLIKIAVDSIPPFTMVAARLMVAAPLLVLFCRLRGFSFPRERTVWIAFLVQGLLQSALPFTLITQGETQIGSGLAGVLNATPPIFVLLIALVSSRGRQSLDGRKITGVTLGLGGVVVTIGWDALHDMGSAAAMAQLAVLGASLCYALAPIWGRRFIGLPAPVTAAGAMSCAALLLLPAAIIIERPWSLAPTGEAVLAVIVLAVLCTAVAMVLYFRLIRTLGALGTTSGSYLRAGFAVLLGMLFLDESLTWSGLAGMALILLGVVCVTLPSRRMEG